jgi:hypothetical protein
MKRQRKIDLGTCTWCRKRPAEHDLLIPAWGRICNVCRWKKFVEMYQREVVLMRVRLADARIGLKAALRKAKRERKQG